MSRPIGELWSFGALSGCHERVTYFYGQHLQAIPLRLSPVLENKREVKGRARRGPFKLPDPRVDYPIGLCP
jgi:hypothetical protein